VAPAVRSTKQLIAAVSRLTGDPGTSVRHGKIFRVVVRSRDGVRCGVPVQVDDHPGEPRPYALNQIADGLLVPRAEIQTVLETWTREQLVRHLEQFTQKELKPPRLRR